ncbi:hypothetical protein PAERUG_E16_London_17_VIM_2_04_14_06261 [Pseudomonas aeruginosa]|nr:hypothetical protein PAERUG_E16_London_17_VIM_2_04_14_06261 [Pseudomonas aeruginosa]
MPADLPAQRAGLQVQLRQQRRLGLADLGLGDIGVLQGLALQRRFADHPRHIAGRQVALQRHRLGLHQVGGLLADQDRVLVARVLQVALLQRQLLLGPRQFQIGAIQLAAVGVAVAAARLGHLADAVEALDVFAHRLHPALRGKHVEVGLDDIQRRIVARHQHRLGQLALGRAGAVDLARHPTPVVQHLRRGEIVDDLAEVELLRPPGHRHGGVVPPFGHLHLGACTVRFGHRGSYFRVDRQPCPDRLVEGHGRREHRQTQGKEPDGSLPMPPSLARVLPAPAHQTTTCTVLSSISRVVLPKV